MSFEIIQRISKTECCLHVLKLTNVKSTLFLRFLPLHKLKNVKKLKVLSYQRNCTDAANETIKKNNQKLVNIVSTDANPV